ncbi:hypothetical protein TWF481_006250 [Arthrobotrys musiformis]|uniref:Uncharacterized protein n=1 Tax=Arthrobotrys musiformis TaxID=47236 RepID=A0AAV9WG45_9PEZI
MNKRRSKPTMAERAARRGYTSEVASVSRGGPNVYCPKKLRPVSENDYKSLSEKWRQFNDYTGKPPTYGFCPGDVITVVDLKEFMRFCVEGSPGGIISEDISSHTLRTMLRKFKGAEARWGNKTITHEMCKDVRNYIDSQLAQDIGRAVPTEQRKKVHINKRDFFEVMDYLWIEDDETCMRPLARLQLSLFTMISAFTLSRPGGIALTKDESEPTSALCYKDITLILVQPDPHQEKLILLLEIKLRNQKHRRGHDELYTNVILHDCDKFRPVSQFVALALHDDAFEAKISAPQDLLTIRPLHEFYQRSIEFHWKASHLKKPIFRNQRGEAMRSTQMNYHLRTLGMRMGFRFSLTPYSIRYGVSNAIEGKTTLDRRRQILGHLKNGTWSAHYMSKTALTDLQSLFVGLETEAISEEIINTTGHLRYRDSRAPQSVDSVRLEEVKKADTTLQELSQELQALRKKQKGERTDDENLKIQDVALAFHNRSKLLRNKQLKQEREEFFDSIHTRDIDEQLEGQSLQETRGVLNVQEPLSGPRLRIVERLESSTDLDVIDPVLVESLMLYLKVQRSGWIGENHTPSLKRKFEKLKRNPDAVAIGQTTVEEIQVQSDHGRAQVRRIKANRLHEQLVKIREETLQARQEAERIETEVAKLESTRTELQERIDAIKGMADRERWAIYRRKKIIKDLEETNARRMKVLQTRSADLDRANASAAEAASRLEAQKAAFLARLEDERQMRKRREIEKQEIKGELKELEAKLTTAQNIRKVEEEAMRLVRKRPSSPSYATAEGCHLNPPQITSFPMEDGIGEGSETTETEMALSIKLAVDRKLRAEVEESLAVALRDSSKQTVSILTQQAIRAEENAKNIVAEVEAAIKEAVNRKAKAEAGRSMALSAKAGYHITKADTAKNNVDTTATQVDVAKIRSETVQVRADAEKALVQLDAEWDRRFRELNIQESPPMGNTDRQIGIAPNDESKRHPTKPILKNRIKTFQKIREMMDLATWSDYADNSRRIYGRLIGDKGRGKKWQDISEEIRGGARECLRNLVINRSKDLQENNMWIAEYFLSACHREAVQNASRHEKRERLKAQKRRQ